MIYGVVRQSAPHSGLYSVLLEKQMTVDGMVVYLDKIFAKLNKKIDKTADFLYFISYKPPFFPRKAGFCLSVMDRMNVNKIILIIFVEIAKKTLKHLSGQEKMSIFAAEKMQTSFIHIN